MLNLDSARWAELHHAYGAAEDIPNLLRALEPTSPSEGKAEPWFTIWSALAHQGSVYSASFAAVPHIISILARSPQTAEFSFFHFPAWVEICRRKANVAVPDDLSESYFAALRRLPSLVAAAAERPWDENALACALSAIAVSKGYPSVAEASLELTPAVAEEFLEWFFSR